MANWEAAVLPLNYARAEDPDFKGYHYGMIEVVVNGAAHRLEQPLDLGSLLEHLQMAGKKVAVERNGEIVPRSAHASTLLDDGDRLEIVVAVGGG